MTVEFPVSPSRVEEEFEGGLDGFFQLIGEVGDGDPLRGGCVSYAAAFCDVLEIDEAFGTFLPDVEAAEAPMHVLVKIDSSLYDVRGEVNRQAVLERAVGIFWEDWPRMAREIRDDGDLDKPIAEGAVYNHVEQSAGKIDPDWLYKYPNYDHNVRSSVRADAKDLIRSELD